MLKLLPQDKSALVMQLRRERGPVAMVGDGIDEGPALAAADIGIAVASGTGAAMAAADITLVHGGVGAVADAVMLARATRRIIRQNLGWAFGYNLLLVPLAAAGILPPVLAALAMAISSVTVVGNALRLRRFGSTSRHRTGHPATARSPPRPARADDQRGRRTNLGCDRPGPVPAGGGTGREPPVASAAAMQRHRGQP